MQRWIGWGIFFLIVALVMGLAIMGNISTNRLLDDATSGVPERQKMALKALAEREGFFDLLQSREKPERMRVAEGVEHLGDATALKVGLEMLKDPDPAVRERFLNALIQIGKPNVSKFVDGLKNGDPNIKSGTVKAMIALGTDSLPTAIEAINNGDARVAAGQVLIKLGSVSVPGLLELLGKTQDEGVKLFVIETLGKIGDKRATPAILPYLSLSPEKRRIVISALGLIADPKTENVLTNALRNMHEDSDARVQAAYGLGKIATPTAIAELVRALKDFDFDVRLAVAAGLQSAGTKALPALKTVIQNSDADVRILGVTALGGISEPGSVALLSSALNDPDPRVQREAATALGETKRSEAVPILINALSSRRDGGVVMAAAEALVKFGDSAIPILINQLGNADPTRAYYAALSLSHMGDPAAQPLINASNDPAKRKWALIALSDMRVPQARQVFERALASGDPDLQHIANQGLMGLKP